MTTKKPLTSSSASSKHTPAPAEIDFAFGKKNYILMLAGIAVIIVGFLLMTGGNSNDPNVFNPELFSFRRITLAPFVVLLGFGIEIYAILKKSEE